MSGFAFLPDYKASGGFPMKWRYRMEPPKVDTPESCLQKK
jgi:hypothetical protein